MPVLSSPPPPLAAVLAVATALTVAGGTASAAPLEGIVVDATGAPVPGARLVLAGPAGDAVSTVTAGAAGRFVLDAPPGAARLRVSAPGFAEVAIEAVAPDDSLRLVLRPAGLAEAVSVTAARGSAVGAPAAVSILSAADLLGGAPGGLDDALRHTPGFSLFRRSSARVANPTTQGVTLRGVSGSGASRTLVLADGLPLNDPFGSWVYWNRFPVASLERVEVLRGGGGDLYGPDALGGVVQLLTFEPDAPRLRFLGEVGEHGSGRTSAYAAGPLGGAVRGEAAGEWGRGGDVFVVAPADRGAADVEAGAEHWSGSLALGWGEGAWRGRIEARRASEERENGTPLQVNDTDWRRLAARVSGALGGGALLVRLADGDQTYRQSFSAVIDERAAERLTTRQRVPASETLAAAEWARPFGRHALLAGVEGRRVRATVEQTRFSFAGDVSGPFLAGGVERTASAFARARVVPAPALALVAAARFDAWRSEPREAEGAPRDVSFWSPRLAVEWRPASRLVTWAAVSRAQRTPTQNELYRGFRVGSVVTAANAALLPERLRSAELGMVWSSARGSLRATGFLGRLEDAIANVTLGVESGLIQRQRRNAGEVDAKGVELEAELRPHSGLRLSAFAALTSSRFRGTPELPDLEGNRVPQVPRLHWGAAIDWSAPLELSLSARLRHAGEQFDDDRNELALGAFTVLDATVSRPVAGGAQVFVAAENLFDAEYDVARTPLRRVGWPRTLRAGLRLFLP